MTQEDMISRQAAIDALDKGAWGVEWDKALAKAMLENLPSAQLDLQQSCNHLVTDCISRQAVLDLFENHANGSFAYGIVWSKIKELPSVQPEQKMGKWILLDECSNSGYYCSECHKRVVKEGWSNTVKKIKHCPNCGAKMEVE